MSEKLKAVAYCRYSSHLQREESIKAQLRAIQKYADDNGYILLDSYIDEAQSAKTDDRISFQQLMSDIKSGNIKIDAVVVHKGDRFARNRYDAAIYKNFLKQHHIKLLSVTENLQDNPESVILESVLEGMAEYYSLNLQREVRKGLKENALGARTTGGTPPLGYDVDKSTQKLIINESEAEAVKMIFRMYLNGFGYSEIINELNANGYKTKRGQVFGKNSINSILHNLKYTGVYTYNLVAPKYKASGKPIRYGKAENDDIIRIDDAVPQIISKEDFEAVQTKMRERQHKAGCYNAKANYLLSGKIFCGECGSPYSGNKRKASSTHPEYISYRCSKQNGKKKCNNKEIRKELVEDMVLNKLSDIIFDNNIIPKILDNVNEFIVDKESSVKLSKINAENKLKELSKQIDNLVDVIANTGSKAIVERLESLESEKVLIEDKIHKLDRELSKKMISKTQLERLFSRAKSLFEQGTLDASKRLIDLFVERVDIYKDHIEIKLNILPTDTPPKARKDNDNSDELFDLGKLSITADRREY